MSRLLSAEEVAERLGISRSLAYVEMRTRMLHVRVGSRGIRVAEASLEAYIRRRSHEPCQIDYSAVARRGSAGSTIAPAVDIASARSAQTDAPRSKPSGNSNDKRKIPIRITQPRKPRTA